MRRVMLGVAAGAFALGLPAGPAGGAAVPAAAKAPLISFEIKPAFVGCRDGQRPYRAKVFWRVTNDASLVSISGAVNAAGKPLPPIVVSSKPHRRDVQGSRKVYLLCSGTTQVLTMHATGSGGTSSTTASLLENHA
jgi:hypothetical protein